MGCSACGGSTPRRTNLAYIIEKQGSSLPFLKSQQCAYEDQFTKLFLDLGIATDTPEKLKMLAWLIDTGNDKKGFYLNKDKQPVVFDGDAVLRKIDITKPVRNNCSV